MDDAEMREILVSIARDREVYPRDRIAAIKALHELGFEEPAAFSRRRDDRFGVSSSRGYISASTALTPPLARYRAANVPRMYRHVGGF
jgi:hypothetical protein